MAPILPLSAADYGRVVAAATGPVARLVVVLAGVQAARPGQIRNITLADADMWQCRLMIAGNPRRVDGLTRTVLLDRLVLRHTTWPGTANAHLLLPGLSARSKSPVSITWLRDQVAGSGVSLNRPPAPT